MFHGIRKYISLLFFVAAVHGIDLQIPQGTLSGDTRTNIDGGSYYIFKSIPYSQPPVGELRFKTTQLAGGWDGVRDATQDAPTCNNQEDCLYLNVYTPGLPEEDVSGLPVMFRIHGGGFEGGASGEMNYGGGFLMTKDIVFVSINYRLGALGYLALDDPNLGATGSAGMKDQVIALQWVQQNIEYFGGDPNNVLIFGESAGSMSVHLHLLSSMSAGLFHKAISESGTAFTPDVVGWTRNSAVMVAEYLGIQTDDWEAMLTSLQEVDVSQIRAAQNALTEDYPYLFRTVVEVPSDEQSFLDRLPSAIIEAGDFNQVPYINGLCDMEGTMVLGMQQTGTGPIEDLTEYIPPDLRVESGSEAEQDIVQRIRDFYYNGQDSTWDNALPDIQLDTDFQFHYPHYRASTGQVLTASQPTYLYYFSTVTALNPSMSSVYIGAGHANTANYLFYNTQNSQNTIEPGSAEDIAWRNLVDLWTNFAIYGNPTPEGFDYTWEPVQADQTNYLHIANNGSFVQVNINQEYMDFWDAIYADYYPGDLKLSK